MTMYYGAILGLSGAFALFPVLGILSTLFGI